MPIPIMTATAAADKWREVTPGRGRYYQANAPAAAESWERETLASVRAYQQGITAAGIERRFEGGVRKAGATKFRRKVTDVGFARFAPGVTAAGSDYQTGVQPYFETIAAATLPARAPRGDPTNYQRTQQIGTALHSRRLAILGAG